MSSLHNRFPHPHDLDLDSGALGYCRHSIAHPHSVSVLKSEWAGVSVSNCDPIADCRLPVCCPAPSFCSHQTIKNPSSLRCALLSHRQHPSILQGYRSRPFHLDPHPSWHHRSLRNPTYRYRINCTPRCVRSSPGAVQSTLSSTDDINRCFCTAWSLFPYRLLPLRWQDTSPLTSQKVSLHHPGSYE